MKLTQYISTLYSWIYDERLLCYLGSHYLGTCPGVGAFYLSSQNSYMGAYPGVGACLGHYSSSKYLHCANLGNNTFAFSIES